MTSTIAVEVVKHLEALSLTKQAQVLSYVIRLRSTQPNDIYEEDNNVPSVSDVIARIQATPPNLAMITPPQGSLADALRDEPADPDFDLERWEQEWSAASDELRRINLEDDVAEGHI